MDAMQKLSAEDQATLQKFLEADPADIENGLQEAQAVLRQILDNKAFDDAPTPPEPAEADDYEVIREKIFADLKVDELSAAFNQVAAQINSLNDRFKKLEASVKRTEDEIVTSAFEGPTWLVDKGMDAPTEEEQQALREGALTEDKSISGETSGGADNLVKIGLYDPLGLTS